MYSYIDLYFISPSSPFIGKSLNNSNSFTQESLKIFDTDIENLSLGDVENATCDNSGINGTIVSKLSVNYFFTIVYL